MHLTKFVEVWGKYKVIPSNCSSWEDAKSKDLPWISITPSRANLGKYFFELHYFPPKTNARHNRSKKGGLYLAELENAVKTAQRWLRFAILEIEAEKE